MFVLTVKFVIKDEHTQDFMPAMRENAAASLSLEPGCLQFDVCSNEDGTEVFLYEVYTDADAFEVHKGMDHFKEFDAGTAPWVADKQVASYTLVQGDALTG